MAETEQKFPKVVYKTLLAEYEDRLISMERGFTLDEEFLELWVPDEDPNKSIFYLFEAAFLRIRGALTVIVDAETMVAVDGEGLIHSLAAFGKVTTQKEGSDLSISVLFGEEHDKKADIEEVRGLSTLHNSYRDRLVRNSRELKGLLNGPFDLKKETSGLFTLQVLEHAFKSEAGDGKITVAFEPKTGKIHVMKYQGLETNHVFTRMLEILTRLSVGFGLQEISEHGVIRVENYLRDPSKPAPVRGLVTPRNAGKHFAALNVLTHELYSVAREKFGVEPCRNTSEEPISAAWLALSEKERLDKVSVEAKKFLKQHRLDHVVPHAVGIRFDIQVYVDFDGVKSERERRFIIKGLEKDLKVALETRIEVYLPTAEDKLRRDKKSTLVKDHAGTIRKSDVAATALL